MAKVEPQTYSAIEVAERDAAEREALPRQMEPNEKPVIESDPMTSFENFHYEMKAIFSAWMTFSKDARISRIKELSKGISTFMRENYKITRERRLKMLNYVIWLESVHPHGDREVAAVAFNGLFGVRKKETE